MIQTIIVRNVTFQIEQIAKTRKYIPFLVGNKEISEHIAKYGDSKYAEETIYYGKLIKDGIVLAENELHDKQIQLSFFLSKFSFHFLSK